MVRRIGVLTSGGLDSAVLVHQLLQRGATVMPLYIRCGLRWEAVEGIWLRRWLAALRTSRLQPLQVITLPLRAIYGNHWSLRGRAVPGSRSTDRAVYLPGRNVLLMSVAAIRCAHEGISTIAIGTLKGNPFGDASLPFFRQLARCLSQALEYSITIITPLVRRSKVDVIRSTHRLPLGLTFSCLQPRGQHHCGRCNKCAERQRAFRAAGVVDPTRYAR